MTDHPEPLGASQPPSEPTQTELRELEEVRQPGSIDSDPAIVALESVTANAVSALDLNQLRTRLEGRRDMDRRALRWVGIIGTVWTAFAVIGWVAGRTHLSGLGSILLSLWLGPLLWIVFFFMRRRRTMRVAERGALDLASAALRVEGNAQSERTILKACFALGMIGALIGLVSFVTEGRPAAAISQAVLLCLLAIGARRAWGKDFGQVLREWSMIRHARPHAQDSDSA